MRSLYQDREISTLSFNERVLQEAEDPRNPLMERMKFLGIFSSNMDEFYKVRVASIHRLMELGTREMGRVLEFVSQKSRELDKRFQVAYRAVVAGLAEEDVRILNEHDIAEQPEEIQNWVKQYFRTMVLPNLVPLLVDERRRFPQLQDGALYFAIKMFGAEPRYAILRIPNELPRFVELPNHHTMYLDDVIRYELDEVFYIFDYEKIEAYEFKILRDAELDMDNDFSEDYVRRMREELESRKGGRPTRLVYDAAIPPVLLKLLTAQLRIGDDYPLIGGARYHNMRDLIRFPNKRPDLSFERREEVPHPILDRSRTPVRNVLRNQDIVVTYPYQSFDHVIRVMREAAIDPEVTAIKMCLYRVARPSQVVNALVNAARNGKNVVVSIELQARFDEANNIRMSERLQEAGATVVFGIPPMKVHSKLLLVERGEERYAVLSTGNFNESTGRLYVDTALMTSDPRLTGEIAVIFDYLERASRMRLIHSPRFKYMFVSPFNLRRGMSRLIGDEAKKGKKGYICLKVNHLTDMKLIGKLRRAADAGVQIDLIVRTTYAMLPHDNVRAISILDRHLEHQRIFVFGRGKDRVVYMGSSDLMERNLDWRLEIVFPVLAEEIRREIMEQLSYQLRDNTKARVLDERQSNGYVEAGEQTYRTQDDMYAHFREMYEAASRQPSPPEEKIPLTVEAPETIVRTSGSGIF